jgi:penicillin-binding protein 2
MRATDIEREEEEHPTRDDVPFVSRRLVVLSVLFGLVLSLYGAQLYKLTVLRGPEYQKFSENNFLLSSPLVPPRGRLVDRHGAPLAINQLFYEVQMSPYKLEPKAIRATLEKLALLLGQPKIAGKAPAVIGLRPRWKSERLAEGLTLEQVLPVLEQSFLLPGVEVHPHYRRYYPEGSVTSLLTGFVASINPKEAEAFAEAGYMPDEKVGKQGAERTFEEILHGTVGQEVVVRDAHGRPRSRYVGEAAEPGQEVVLTLDLGLQRLADQLLQGWKGVIIAIDPRDGAIRALAARPNFDPNNPTPGILSGESTFVNRATSEVFAPGSTFKIVTATAGLLAGHSPKEVVDCDGMYHLPGVTKGFPCNVKWGHGSDDMYEGLQHSCNVFFYTWARAAGGERMLSAAAAFGFGQKTDIELASNEKRGTLGLPPGEKPYAGDVLHMGIGQGRMIAVTPIQVARAYAALANGGKLLQPKLLQEVRLPTGEVDPDYGLKPEVQGTLPLTDQQRGEILEGLREVVSEPRGTAHRAGLKPEWNVYGKTGTAQTGKPNVPANGWFACFAPGNNPEILFVILYEEAGHGGEMAAPVARQLLAYYFGQPEPVVQPPVLKPKKAAGDEEVD